MDANQLLRDLQNRLLNAQRNGVNAVVSDCVEICKNIDESLKNGAVMLDWEKSPMATQFFITWLYN